MVEQFLVRDLLDERLQFTQVFGPGNFFSRCHVPNYKISESEFFANVFGQFHQEGFGILHEKAYA